MGHASGSPIALKAARIFDGISSRVEDSGVVVIEGERIAAAGSGLRVPSDAKIIDLGDCTLCPGFIDAHTHLTAKDIRSYDEGLLDRFRLHTAEKAYYAARNARVTLESGFTAVRDVGCMHRHSFIDVSLRNSIDKGLLPGPRMMVAGNTIGATGGHADASGGLCFCATGHEPDHTEGVADGPVELRKAVRFNVKFGVDVIKFCASGGVLSLADEVDTPQLTLEEMTALVDEAHRLRKKVATHCHGDRAARDAVLAGVDSIEHGSFLERDTLILMKEKGVSLVPTLLPGRMLLRNPERLPANVAEKARAAVAGQERSFSMALELGVSISFGTDAGVFPHGKNAQEFGLMVRYGMSPLLALRSATSVNATLLGLSSKLGSLHEGKYADIVAVPGDPSRDPASLEKPLFIMKGGAVVRGVT